MKPIRKWSSIGLLLLMIAGAVAGWMVIGNTPSTEAQTAQTSGLPPEVLSMQGHPHGAPPPPLTWETVIESLRNNPDGPGIIEEARKLKMAGPHAQGPPAKWVRRLKGSHTPHPDFERLKALKQQEPPPRSHPMTKEEFLEYLKGLPNGPDLIEKLKKQGKGTGMGPDGSGSGLFGFSPFNAQEGDGLSTLLSLLNPIKDAMAQPMPDQAILTPASPSSGPHSFQCFGAMVGTGFPPTPSVYMNPSDESATTGSRVMPYMLISYDATSLWNAHQRAFWAVIRADTPGASSPPQPGMWQWDGANYTPVPAGGLPNGWLGPNWVTVTVPITGPGMKYLYLSLPSVTAFKAAGGGPADLDGDGHVDFNDFFIMAANIGNI